jgi:hypothetical protein
MESHFIRAFPASYPPSLIFSEIEKHKSQINGFAYARITAAGAGADAADDT